MLFKLVGLEEILPQMRSMQTIGVLIYLRRRLLSDLNHFWYDFITSLPLSFINLYLSQALLHLVSCQSPSTSAGANARCVIKSKSSASSSNH